MKLNPAIIVLSFLFALMIGFMWVIYPRYTDIPDVTDLKHRNVDFVALADEWRKTPSYIVTFNALDPSYEVTTSTNSLFDPSDDYFGLPRDNQKTFELVEAYCTACHSLSIVMQQKATPERWEELLDWMEKKQGMQKLPPEDEMLILEYLSTHFSSSQ
ncbi:MAG: hypothetical protein ABJG88_12870 [Litorimonas sp.]